MAQTSNERPIYLDYQATTPVDERVLSEMMPFFRENFGNPHSVHHAYGQAAEAAVKQARAEVADLIGADPREVIFTSGATESNNTAIKGAAHFHAPMGKRHVVTVQTEHKCVLESCKRLERDGFEVTYLPVDSRGLISPKDVAGAIREDTVLVSVMAVNNETGVIQPIEAIGELCRERRIYFHVDAAQAVGKIPLDVNRASIDLLSISGHKIYGPKGVGALYVRRRPRTRLEPLLDGGGQERGLRSGTVPTPLAVGLGAACRIAGAEMADEAEALARLSARLWQGLSSEMPDLRLNGDADARIPGNLNVCFPGLEAETLIAHLPNLAVSTASACSAASVEPSYVLSAMGLSDADAAASLRIGLGRFTTADDIEHAISAIASAVAHLRGAQDQAGRQKTG